MSDDFKERLERYLAGELPPEEREELERELDKLEAYQGLIEAQLDKENSLKSRRSGKAVSGSKLNPVRVVSRAKWKARFQNALVAVAIVLVVLVVSSGVTSFFYTLGEPSRMETYRDVVVSTIAVTEPNVMARSTGSQIGTFLTLHMDGDLVKRVGGAESRIGGWGVRFLLGQAGYPDWHWDDGHKSGGQFLYPSAGSNNSSPYKSSFAPSADWNRLEKLPEGTVAEVYLSFDKFYGTAEVLARLEGKNLLPVWFAADTGLEQTQPETVVGFPYEPLWHYGDAKVVEHSEQKEGLLGKSVHEVREYPPIEAYGSAELRDKNFIDTLKLLYANEQIAERVAYGPPLDLEQRIDYLETNGVRLYGMVVTGPTTELLELKDEPWVAGVRVGEAALWNWTERGE